ncbi:MAG: tetratricopeptide (TPR) repeat protein [Candidatus Latescibacterota bacterium]
MALPALFYTLLGYATLSTLPTALTAQRLLRWSILPVALLHTALWIGINADQERALNRLGNQLQRSGYALHAQAFARGHYYLNLRQDDYDRAIFHLRQALELAPSKEMSREKGYPIFLAKALHNAGVQRHTQADYAGAIAAYREAIEWRPDYASAWRNLGLAYRETSAYELSLVAHQTALQSDPSLSDSHYDIGVLYNQLGRQREAVSAYEQMLHLDAGDARARYNLGLTYVQLGEWNAAREQYEKLRGLGSELAKSMAPYLRNP